MSETFDKLLDERFGVASAPRGMTANAVIEQILSHRTVRSFTGQPLPEGTLETLVAAAQSAASSSNLQAFSIVAVRDSERRTRLSEIAGNQAHIKQAPLLMVWVADLSRLDRIADRRGERSDANLLSELMLVAIIDAALAAQNAAIAAESLGLGTCYIGALRNRVDLIAEELRLPQRAFAVFGMCVGHADPARPATIKPRLPETCALHHEVYSTETEVSAIAEYDEVMQSFQRSQSMKVVPWSELVSSRVRGIESVSGRHVLYDWLKDRGFMLGDEVPGRDQNPV